MAKTVTFGELLLRLSPEQHKRFVQADRFDAVYGGGEANTAVLLAELGTDASFVASCLHMKSVRLPLMNCAVMAWIPTMFCVEAGVSGFIFSKTVQRSALPR